MIVHASSRITGFLVDAAKVLSTPLGLFISTSYESRRSSTKVKRELNHLPIEAAMVAVS
jgi:hypothetical protein